MSYLSFTNHLNMINDTANMYGNVLKPKKTLKKYNGVLTPNLLKLVFLNNNLLQTTK